ncbi:hypothetical protein DIPPA_21092 [Diplonema papillatum]|nr:hypothetical protein DIPPA_21092 [Diplonema papillatum]
MAESEAKKREREETGDSELDGHDTRKRRTEPETREEESKAAVEAPATEPPSARVEDVVLSRLDTHRKTTGTKLMIFGQTPAVWVLIHPSKVSYLHFVLVPKHAPADEARKLAAVKALAKAAADVVARFASPEQCRKFLFKKGGKFAPAGSDRRWGGPREIEAFMRDYGADAPGKKIEFASGFEASEPVIRDLHLHVLSKDFAYVRDKADWNLYTSDWGLLSADAMVDLLEDDCDVEFPDAGTMRQKCATSDIMCPLTGRTLPDLTHARRQLLMALTGRMPPEVDEPKAAQASPPQKSSATKSEGKPSSEKPSRTEKILASKPVRPKAKVKPVKESIQSGFQKWSEYYYHLKYAKTPDDNEEVMHAVRMMKDLANHPALKPEDAMNFNEMQLAARAVFFPKTKDQRQKRAARWNGSELQIDKTSSIKVGDKVVL